MGFFDDILKAIGFFAILSGINKLFKDLKPPSWDSWKTLLWISAFSWLFSLIVRNQSIEIIIASFGWVFLIAGLHWAMYDEDVKVLDKKLPDQLKFNGFFVGPWITGALICVFLRGLFNDINANDALDIPLSVAFISWPPISALLSIAPAFFAWSPEGPVPAVPKKINTRQQLINLFLFNLLLSCWFQLYFSTQTWLMSYPTLISEDFSNSAFVFRFPTVRVLPSRGQTVLDQTEAVVHRTLSGASWSDIERWLLDLNRQLPTVQQEVMQRLSPMDENSLWRLEAKILPGQDYTVEFRSLWQGPTSDNRPFYFAKTCRITRRTTGAILRPIQNPANTLSPEAQMRCGGVRGPIKIEGDRA